MDAMVTARMPVGKKEAGAEVLESLGLTASQFINDMWDRLIAERANPLDSETERALCREMALKEAEYWLEEIKLPDVDPRFKTMTDDEIRLEYYRSRGYLEGLEI